MMESHESRASNSHIFPNQQYPVFNRRHDRDSVPIENVRPSTLVSNSIDKTHSLSEYSGAENKFIIVNTTDQSVQNDRKLALDILEQRNADGVIYLSIDDDCDFPRVGFKLVQPDGSTAAMCGNGARCAAMWAANQTGAESVIIDTPAGQRSADVNNSTVRLEMGMPSFAPSDIPLNRDEPLINEQIGGYSVTAVNTGVPHAVIFVDNVREVSIKNEAPLIRHANIFQNGTNVTFASIEDTSFYQRTFERGVEGETAACGTGAVAIATVAHQKGLVEPDESVTISPPGGDLSVTVRSDGSAVLEGPAEKRTESEVVSSDINNDADQINASEQSADITAD